MLSIKAILGSYLKSVRSFSEMVPWMGLNASDMVFNVDGSLMVVYEVAGIDAEGRLPIETDGYVENFERALKVTTVSQSCPQGVMSVRRFWRAAHRRAQLLDSLGRDLLWR